MLAYGEGSIKKMEYMMKLWTYSELQGKTLVVYYSATNNTAEVARVISQATDGDLFEIWPTEPYTDEDLDWTNDKSRVC